MGQLARLKDGSAIPLLGALSALMTSDPTIASTALVHASRDFSMSVGLIITASSVSVMALSATVVSTGVLADRIGRRRTLMLAVIVASLGELVVALSPSPVVYLIGRLIAGVGLGAVFGASYAMVRAVVPTDRLSRAMGSYGAIGGIVGVVLAFMGGALAGVNWRLSFLVIPVIGLLLLLCLRSVLPDVPPTASGSLDVWGQVLLGVGTFGILLGLSQSSHGWLAPRTLIPLAVGVVSTGAFFVVEHRGSHPFFPVSIFRNTTFIAALCAGCVFSAGNSVTVLQMSNLWQYRTGLTPGQVALWQLPFLVAGIVGGYLAGRVMTTLLSPATVITLGAFMTSGGLVSLALAGEAQSFWSFLPGLLLTGAGIMVIALPSRMLILNETPREYFGPVTSSRTSFGIFFYTAGISLSTTLVASLTVGGLVRQMESAGASPARIGSALEIVETYVSSGLMPQSTSGVAMLSEGGRAYSSAYFTVMMVTALALLAIGLTGAWLARSFEGPRPVSS